MNEILYESLHCGQQLVLSVAAIVRVTTLAGYIDSDLEID